MNTNNWHGSILVLITISFAFLLSYCVVKPVNVNENKPRIYGLTHNLNGGGGHQLVDINHDTGAESNPRSLGITTSVFGIARKYSQTAGQNIGIITAIEGLGSACGAGTAFYRVDLTTGQNTKLGIAQGYEYIEDIEYNPLDNQLYGIFQDILVRIDQTGTCAAQTNGTPAQITDLGKLNNIGEGPYSLYFDHLGACYIISAKEHRRAIVEIPATPNPAQNLRTIGPLMVDTSWNPPANIDFIRVASAMSGTTAVIGIVLTTSTAVVQKNYYHFGNPSWLSKGKPAQVIDYTSQAMIQGPK